MPVKAHMIPLSSKHIRLTEYPELKGQFRYEDAGSNPAPPPAKGCSGRLNFACPRHNKNNCGSVIIGNGFKPGGKSTWKWDGNITEPTLEPSINCLAHNPDNPKEKYAGCGWHGYLRKGQFEGDGL